MQYQAANGHINVKATKLGAQMAQQQDPVDEGQSFPISLSDLTALTIRLARVLAEEVDCLAHMKIKDIEVLQEEKTRLARTIGLMKGELERNPSVIETFTEDEKESFRQVSSVFDTVLEENRRRLLVAKEVNMSVVQAISDVVREEAQRAGYNRRGGNGMNRALAPSVSLNKTI